MLSIAELAHQRDPQAITEIIRQELQSLNYQNLHIEVTIVDSNLELQIRTDSAIDKEKLLTLISSNLQNLHIESVAKFKVQCWRNDGEMHEQRLLWKEKVMLEPLQSTLSQASEMESEQDVSEGRTPETQLSKDSVLQKAISTLSKKYSTEEKSLQVNAHLIDHQEASTSVNRNGVLAKIQKQEEKKLSSSNDYWQLVLVGSSIMLLGLGIGAFARALTTKRVTEPLTAISSTTSSDDKLSNPKPTTSPNLAGQISDPIATSTSSPTTSTNSPNIAATENSTASETVSVTPNSSTNSSQEKENLITLEKFNRVQKGMTVEQVEQIFGVSGKVIAENTANNSVGKVYSWKNPQGSNAIIEFKDGQVVAKAQAGL
ncbi:MAG: hypothetical protein ACK5EU_00960 [Pseudanabaena sp.]|jgi:hypothetical protein|nr:hypothetical protein [Pseudanabaena sp. M53BS1SP1A06MG]MCA6581534.1 hypothetical protein [Pseudanabaena sp. M34BS1SP1A06MG]MCA6586622.1 hypothetical protein [Pseudanabaena sp. M051S1SP1A06QC]MCA6594374.1 hypothetical protein [Pseudanabaena sp. M38BS1SP1A06MG]MCA6597580.1 hypothetical protein [Pseudanabaena sp. M046S1SP1A06QC]MCA6602748.1 hypothetical protein [Pseudanabaena sp. M57BS1SP1A06MG]MCA6605920.1 hypothetical protein [Pseudanabaena sp. M007S1SP1A06QC]MCA6612764.1 hypothetical prot